MTLAFFILSFFFLFAALHPFVTYPFTLIALRKWFYRPLNFSSQDELKETYAICVCAYNEESVIASKIENMLALRRILPGLEILVYVDAAGDKTAEIAKKYEDDITLFISPSRHGKTYGMNLLVSLTKASVIIFTDANVIFDCESFRTLPRYFSDPQIGCVCGHLKYINEAETMTAKNGSLYWRMEESIRQLECETGSIMGADGSIFVVRKHLHQPPPEGIVDDMFISMNIVCDGYRVIRAPEIVVYEKSVTSAREEFQRKIRIACLALNAHFLLWPRLRRLPALELYKYVSHKLLRWFVIYWLGLSAITFVAAMKSAGLGDIALQLVLGGAAILGLGCVLRLPIALQIIDILVAFAGTGVGVWRSLQGDSFKIWVPANSVRADACAVKSAAITELL